MGQQIAALERSVGGPVFDRPGSPQQGWLAEALQPSASTRQPPTPWQPADAYELFTDLEYELADMRNAAELGLRLEHHGPLIGR